MYWCHCLNLRGGLHSEGREAAVRCRGHTVPSRLTVYNVVEAMDKAKLALYRDTSVHLGTAHLSLT